MPRGRHRHSPPLHRLLQPSAVAGVSVICAGGAWLVDQPAMLRALAAAAAAACVTGSVLMRAWDRAAGRRVAELTRSRAADQWRTEERIAELETELEESRELRGRLDAKLRTKRMELAGLRGEHAALLRRYATAETERASALEGRRQLALESTGPKALMPSGSTPTPASYLAAARALESLSLSAERQAKARAEAEASRTREPGRPQPSGEPRPSGESRSSGERPSSGRSRPSPESRPSREDEEPQGKHAAVLGNGEHSRPSAALTTGPRRAELPAPPAPVAAAVVPHPARRAVRPEGSFDFFGTGGAQPGESAERKAAAIEAVQDEDLADVVGAEVLANRAQQGPDKVVGEVIDLTVHDETEQLDVAVLRTAIS
ncbi:hypothetical protein DWB77_03480 [Streptomyces hundungensis]|uniref:Secreted protein n=1 Tax=Streptomyces hundungensis TaxID=1077946 RepID=A0A387HD16_9ACTN|nr:hypothetical protein [Streptomyces hundungensis]AYG81334.1 hypothetical protein DWB77_03480 [Streptomyces hundungensis]